MQRSLRNKMMTRFLPLSVVLLAVLCSPLNAYQTYQSRIPNGDKVPNPCNRSTIWPGVGHQNVYGSGVRNPFGADFAANNHLWNLTLCQKDSDGDGRSNGQELGDPNCTWTQGRGAPAVSVNLTHPGVCEPIGSPLCSGKNSWLMNCMPAKLNCSAINQPEVRNYTMVFPPKSPVPAQETTYICYKFALPNDTVSDIIAIEPVLDNVRVLHHMLLYGCNDNSTDNPTNKTFKCGMGGDNSCLSLIGIWGAGAGGQCLNNALGFRIGPGGFQYAVLQLHWNNPDNKTNLTDSSGMRIYYTTKLRPNRGQVAMVGQVYLEIPPGQTSVTFRGKCSSQCTKHLPNSVFLTSSTLHMHYMGKSGEIRLSRNGNLVQMLDKVTEYDYNTPTMTEFDTPIELKPGDEIQVECVYQSTGKNTTTYQGEATSDEMCFGFFAYYPMLEDIGFCGQWKSIDICSNKFDPQFDSCDLKTLMKLIVLLPHVCADDCKATACALLMDGIQATGCQNYPDVKKFIAHFMANYGAIYTKCAMERPPKPLCTQQQQLQASDSSGQAVSLIFSLVFTLMAYAVYC